MAHHVLRDGSLADLDTELEQSPWMRGAPKGIDLRDPPFAGSSLAAGSAARRSPGPHGSNGHVRRPVHPKEGLTSSTPSSSTATA